MNSSILSHALQSGSSVRRGSSRTHIEDTTLQFLRDCFHSLSCSTSIAYLRTIQSFPHHGAPQTIPFSRSLLSNCGECATERLCSMCGFLFPPFRSNFLLPDTHPGGGTGWTGLTTCVSGYVCTVSSSCNLVPSPPFTNFLLTTRLLPMYTRHRIHIYCHPLCFQHHLIRCTLHHSTKRNKHEHRNANDYWYCDDNSQWRWLWPWIFSTYYSLSSLSLLRRSFIVTIK